MIIEELFELVVCEIAFILKCDASKLLDSTCSHDVDNWDSLNNVRMLLHLEKKFHIRFTGLETSSLENIGDLVQLIAAKLGDQK
jgi:acyl carrier protein